MERYVDFRVGKNPETEAGVELKRLLRTFMAVKTNIGARRAEIKFWRLHEKYKPFLHEKTHGDKDSWYVHKKLRTVWNHIAVVARRC